MYHSWSMRTQLAFGMGHARSRDYRRIGLLEPIWKVIEAIMDRRLNVVEFNDALHGFRNGRGTGTATTEVKLAQQLAFLERMPWHTCFIDLCKDFDAMDRGRCLEILRGYGVGLNILRLIKQFWDNAVLVCRADGNFGRPFKAKAGGHTGRPPLHYVVQHPD